MSRHEFHIPEFQIPEFYGSAFTHRSRPRRDRALRQRTPRPGSRSGGDPRRPGARRRPAPGAGGLGHLSPCASGGHAFDRRRSPRRVRRRVYRARSCARIALCAACRRGGGGRHEPPRARRDRRARAPGSRGRSSTRRVALPLVAMADPWLVAIFVVGLLALWPGRQRLRTVAPFMLGAAVGFLCLKGALLDRALRGITSRSGVAASRRSALGIAHGMGRVRADAGGASRLAHQQSRRSGHRASVAAAPTGVRAGDGVAIARHREELPARARVRVSGRGHRERGTHGSALVRSALLHGPRRIGTAPSRAGCGSAGSSDPTAAPSRRR